MNEATRLDRGALLAADPRDKEIERLKKERDDLLAREERARSEAREARARLSQFASRSRAFAKTMGSQAVERRRVRQRILAQYQIGRALEDSRSLKEAGPKVFGVLAETLDFDRGVLWRVDAEAGALRCAGVWDAGDRRVPEAFVQACEGARPARGEGLPGRVWQSGRVLVVRDISKEALYRDDPRRKDLVEIGLKGSLAFPVRDGGGASAVFELFCREAPSPDQDLARTMYVVGHQIGQFIESRRVEKDREELLVRERETRAEAEASRREFSGLLESINDAFFALDEERRLTYVNRRTERLWGRTREELLGRNVWETFPRAVGTGYYDAVERALEEGEDASFESYASGLGAWISGRVYPSPGGVSVFFRDITERKEAEGRLRESEERFRAAFEQARVGIVQASLDGRILLPNPGFCQIVGYTEEEARGLHVRDVTHPDDYEADMEQGRRVTRGEIPGYSMEKRYVCKDGSVIWVNLTSTVARGDDGEPLYALAIVEDIDERKKAEEAIGVAADRDRFRVALADALRPLTDPVEIQTEAARVLGEHLGADRVTYADVEDDGDESPTVSAVEQSHASGVSPLAGRFGTADFGLAATAPQQADSTVVTEVTSDPALTDEEKARYAEAGIGAWVGVPLLEDSRFVAALGVHQSGPRAWTAQEVTLIEETADRVWAAVERARAEEALRASEGQLRAIYDGTREYVGLLTTDGTLLRANRASLEFGGDSAEEVIGKPFWETIWFANTPGMAEAVRQGIEVAAKGEFFRKEITLARPTGELRTFDFSLHSIKNERGEVILIVPEGRDITETKRAEEALRESEERYRSLTTATSSIVWTGAPDGACVEEMPAWEQFTGQTFEEYRGSGWLDAVHPEDRPPADAWDGLNAEPVQTEARFRLRRSDGEYRRVVSRGVPIFDEDGSVREYIGTITDIEDELRAEEALGETEAKLMGLFDSNVVGITWGEEQTITECNDAMLGMIGYTREELEDGGIYWPALNVPEEQERIAAAVREAKETGRMTPFEKTLVRKDGGRVPTIFGGYRLEVEPFRYVAFVLDISDRKRAEAERDRYLARELRSRAQAEERKRLSRELHDRVAHAIAVVHQSLELYEALKERNPAGAESRMNLAREMTREALHYTRNLSNRLRNPEVEGGLSAALSNLLSTTVPPHIGSELFFEGDELLVPPRVREQLFLILREAVRNAVAHSGAKHLKIEVAVSEETGVVTGHVEDDGEGFDTRSGGRSSLQSGGLRSMPERAELLGGTLELKSTPGAGTRVEVSVPLEEGE